MRRMQPSAPQPSFAVESGVRDSEWVEVTGDGPLVTPLQPQPGLESGLRHAKRLKRCQRVAHEEEALAQEGVSRR